MKTDYEQFLTLYVSLGIPVYESSSYHGKVSSLIGGYPGFYTIIEFTSEGKFIKQKFLE